jgi:hypothetical protein
MDITQLRIKLPYDMMLEEQKEKKERKNKARVFSFLIDFKEEIKNFNTFILSSISIIYLSIGKNTSHIK